MKYEIYVMDVDGSNQRRLTSNTEQNFAPSWSPDGSKIAFGSMRDGAWEIYVMDTSNYAETLTGNPKNDRDPDWGPAAP